jgi:type IV pilus assembly protein PilP
MSSATMNARRARALTVLLATATIVAACSSPKSGGSNDFPIPPPKRGPEAAASASASAAVRSAFTPEDFTPSERNRDPFQRFEELFKKDAAKPVFLQQSNRRVLAERHALDELKLVAIVTGAGARAMFVDPEGKGWIVTLGQLIGRSETVRAGGTGGADYDLNWKVDRIRENDVVFVRETPGRTSVPTATRVIALRTDGAGRSK